MVNSLEERLKEHSNTFDGLLSLIPAKYYYDEETSSQWKQKRKSNEERKQSKRMKLDPNLSREVTAEQVMKNREKTAKPVIIPGQGTKQIESKTEEKVSDSEGFIKDQPTLIFDDDGELKDGEVEEEEEEEAEEEVSSKVIVKPEVSHKQKASKRVDKDSKPKKASLTEEEKKSKQKHLAELRAKLSIRINAMKAKRKAPGSDVPGAATSRQQILEERRRRWELKKEQQKQRKPQAGEEEASEAEEDSSSDDDDDDDEVEEDAAAGVFYGNIEFADGAKVTSDLSTIRKPKGKKGPAHKDIKSHLKKLEKEKQKLNSMEADTRESFEKKKQWTRAIASVEGEKVKDDEKLLKKALRRKEAGKRKTRKEWSGRVREVHEQKRAKQDRRQENLRIRKENKGRSRKDQVKQLPSHKKLSRANTKRSRAGFEGRLKTGKGRR